MLRPAGHSLAELLDSLAELLDEGVARLRLILQAPITTPKAPTCDVQRHISRADEAAMGNVNERTQTRLTDIQHLRGQCVRSRAVDIVM